MEKCALHALTIGAQSEIEKVEEFYCYVYFTGE